MRKILKKFIIFCLVGGIATILDWGFFNMFFYLGRPFSQSRLFAIAISMIWNFWANRTITFKARSEDWKKQLPKYLIVYIISMGSNYIIANAVYFFLPTGTVYANIAFISGLIISIPLSFVGSLLWAFNTEKSKNVKNVVK